MTNLFDTQALTQTWQTGLDAMTRGLDATRQTAEAVNQAQMKMFESTKNAISAGNEPEKAVPSIMTLMDEHARTARALGETMTEIAMASALPDTATSGATARKAKAKA